MEYNNSNQKINLEERTKDDDFERHLKEERSSHEFILGILTAAPVLTAINTTVSYLNDDIRNATIYGIATVALGGLTLGTYKIYNYLHKNN